MTYELLGEWDGLEPDWPIFGVVQPETSTLSRVTINRFGPDFGNLVWQVSAYYTAERGRSVAVHTVLRRTAISASGESWAESGLPEAKGWSLHR